MGAKNKRESMKIVPPGKKKCVWMEAGVVSYKLCDNNYDCSTCVYDQGMQLKVARQKAEAATELEAARLARAELERRLPMARKAVADLEQKQKALVVEGIQREADQLSMAICEGPLTELIEKLAEVRALEETILERGLTPHVTFATAWREGLEHRLEMAKREVEARLKK